MKIEKLEINEYMYSGFKSDNNDGSVHIKQLPYLSVVQSKTGTYGIAIGQGTEYTTHEGGFFIAPSVATQHITHHADKNGLFEARYIFLDVIINGKYRLDDVFDFPVVTDKALSEALHTDFDAYESSGNICDKYSCIYSMIKHLLDAANEKTSYRINAVFPVIEYIRANYNKCITVKEMSELLFMSESNLYCIFKKETGLSPIKYLNEYRLSVAVRLLKDTGLSVKDIAEKAGFSDQFYFSKLFKAKYNISPRYYRQNIFY